MAVAVDIGTLIDSSPEIRGGRPKIAGTGLAVTRIVKWFQMGMSPEEIATEYEHINLAQVYAALAYYYADREALDADMAAEQTEAEYWFRLHQEGQQRKAG